mmetsp:Transcript_32619/g.80401  ORF Transcript_32619/g.80401 Transcript_32619/m.80401 type:complete len:249 (+) Transcript_32619:288-1034(+)
MHLSHEAVTEHVRGQSRRGLGLLELEHVHGLTQRRGELADVLARHHPGHVQEHDVVVVRHAVLDVAQRRQRHAQQRVGEAVALEHERVLAALVCRQLPLQHVGEQASEVVAQGQHPGVVQLTRLLIPREQRLQPRQPPHALQGSRVRGLRHHAGHRILRGVEAFGPFGDVDPRGGSQVALHSGAALRVHERVDGGGQKLLILRRAQRDDVRGRGPRVRDHVRQSRLGVSDGAVRCHPRGNYFSLTFIT